MNIIQNNSNCYIIKCNDSNEHVVIGTLKQATDKMNRLKDLHFVETNKLYTNKLNYVQYEKIYDWYLLNVKADIYIEGVN